LSFRVQYPRIDFLRYPQFRHAGPHGAAQIMNRQVIQALRLANDPHGVSVTAIQDPGPASDANVILPHLAG